MPCIHRYLSFPAFTDVYESAINNADLFLEIANAINYIRDFMEMDLIDWTITFPIFGTTDHPILDTDLIIDNDSMNHANLFYRNFLFVCAVKIFELKDHYFYKDLVLWRLENTNVQCSPFVLSSEFLALFEPGYTFSIGPNFTDLDLLGKTIKEFQNVLSSMDTIYAIPTVITFNSSSNELTKIGFQYQDHEFKNYTLKYENPWRYDWLDYLFGGGVNQSIFGMMNNVLYNWNNPYSGTFPDHLFIGRQNDFGYSNTDSPKFGIDERYLESELIENTYDGKIISSTDSLDDITIIDEEMSATDLPGDIFCKGEGLAGIWTSLEDNILCDAIAWGSPETNPTLPIPQYKTSTFAPHLGGGNYDPDQNISDWLPQLQLKKRTGTISITPYTVPFSATINANILVFYAWGEFQYSINSPTLLLSGNIAGTSFSENFTPSTTATPIDEPIEIELCTATLTNNCSYEIGLSITNSDFKQSILDNYENPNPHYTAYAQFTKSNQIYSGIGNTSHPHRLYLENINDNSIDRYPYTEGTKNHDFQIRSLNTFVGGMCIQINLTAE